MKTEMKEIRIERYEHYVKRVVESTTTIKELMQELCDLYFQEDLTDVKKEMLKNLINAKQNIDSWKYYYALNKRSKNFSNIKETQNLEVVDFISRAIELVKEHYRIGLAEEIGHEIRLMISDIESSCIPELKSTINEMEDCIKEINPSNYIQKNQEFKKIANLWIVIKDLVNINLKESHQPVYILYGIKELLMEFHFYLNNIKDVEDNNVVCAILEYINEYVDLEALLKLL